MTNCLCTSRLSPFRRALLVCSVILIATGPVDISQSQEPDPCDQACVAGPIHTSTPGTTPPSGVTAFIVAFNPTNGLADENCRTCPGQPCTQRLVGFLQVSSTSGLVVEACVPGTCRNFGAATVIIPDTLRSPCNTPTGDFLELIVHQGTAPNPIYRTQVRLTCPCTP